MVVFGKEDSVDSVVYDITTLNFSVTHYYEVVYNHNF